jgi:hypothetical protein
VVVGVVVVEVVVGVVVVGVVVVGVVVVGVVVVGGSVGKMAVGLPVPLTVEIQLVERIERTISNLEESGETQEPTFELKSAWIVIGVVLDPKAPVPITNSL